MRYIDHDRLSLPDGWTARARARTEELSAARSADNQDVVATLVDSSRGIWTELKPALEDLSAKKCWYCEMSQDRSDLNIDHFRPKSRVAEMAGHPGYWWLMLEWENFRLSCQFCNQRRRGVDGAPGGGKWDHFPLRDEANRAKKPEDSIDIEEVILLDPTHAVDVTLLSFDYEGRTFPNPQKCEPGSFELDRVLKTIELYHLNHRGIVDTRKQLNRALGRQFDLAVQMLGIPHPQPLQANNLSSVVKNLRNAITERSILSASARAYLRSRRADGELAKTLIEELLEY